MQINRIRCNCRFYVRFNGKTPRLFHASLLPSICITSDLIEYDPATIRLSNACTRCSPLAVLHFLIGRITPYGKSISRVFRSRRGQTYVRGTPVRRIVEKRSRGLVRGESQFRKFSTSSKLWNVRP